MLTRDQIDFTVPQFIKAEGCIGIYDTENDYELISDYRFSLNTTTDTYKEEVSNLIREFYAFYGDYVSISVVWEFFDYL